MKNSIFRKSISAVLAFMMMLGTFSSVTVFAEREYAADLSVGGITVDFESEPYSKFDTIFVPLEELAGYLRLELTREGNAYTLRRMRNTLTMEIDNIVCTINGKSLLLKTALVERDGVVYAPVEIFSEGLNCPVTISDDFRSADLQVNVYSVYIDQNNAAAISAANPDKDTLVTGDAEADQLFYKPEEYPEKELAVYYMADLSDFAGKEISGANLVMNVARGTNLNQTLGVQRTKPWVKGEVSFSNQPEIYADQVVAMGLPSELKQSAKNWETMSIDIASLVKKAMDDGEKLSVKMLGNPFRNQKNPGTPQVHIKGVNTDVAPYIELTVNENYVFPVKQSVADSTDENKFDELQLLRAMGVFTDADEFPLDMNETVTRAEFLTYAMRLRGSDIPAGQAEPFFSDVPADNAYYRTVQSAQALGYIVGWQGIAFRPYDAITMGEAITILGRMLNYNIYAEERGGFTPGYFAAAKYGDLYLGVNDNTSLVSFNKMVDLLENALDAKMLDVISYTSDGKAEYIFNEDMTVLTEFWDAQKIEGTVTSNEYGSITPGTEGEEGYIRIDSKHLKLNYEPYNKYLGYKVRGYYSRTEEVLLYIGTVVSSVKEINLSDIEGSSDSENTVSFTYVKENGSRASESFSKDAVVIYNGKSVSRDKVASSLLSADGGKITIVSNGPVIIDAYRTVVVSGVNVDEETVYDMYEEYANLLYMKGKDWTITDAENKKIALESLQKYDVLSVAGSLDKSLYRCILTKKTVDGKITLLENVKTVDEVLTINGIEYETRNRNTDWTEYISLNAAGTFLLNHEGNIVGMVITPTEDILGYIIDVDNSGKSALRTTLQAAIMVQGSEGYVLYDLADSVKIDGKKYTDSAEIAKQFKEGKEENGAFVMQGIIFSLNSDKQINVIDTSEYNKDYENKDTTLYRAYTPIDPATFAGYNASQKRSNGGLTYKSGSGKMADSFFLNLQDALCVVIPTLSDGVTPTTDIEEYMSISSGIGNDEILNPLVYTVGTKTPKASIVVLNGFNPGAEPDGYYVVVDRIVTAFDSEGYEVKKLYYHTAPGEVESVLIPDDIEYKLTGDTVLGGSVERGDIVRIGTDASGNLSAITEYYDYKDKIFGNEDTSFISSGRLYAGMADSIYDKYVKLKSTTEENKYYWVDMEEKFNFYKYTVDSAGVELFNATIADIRPVETVPHSPTGMLLQASYASLSGRTVFNVEMNQPDGTGIYELSYSPNLPADADESQLSGFPTTSARFNPGAETAAEEKGSISLENYEFTGWRNKSTGEEIEPGGKVTINDNTVLEAQWLSNPSVNFTFVDAENPDMKFTMPYQQYSFASGSQQQAYQKLPTAEVASEKGFTKDGYVLIGWKGEDNTEYMLNNTANPDDELYEVPGQTETFTAIWMQKWSGTAATAAPTLDNGYYQIKTGEDLAWFASIVNGGETTANAILMNDIYLNNFLDDDGKQVSSLANWYTNPDNVTGAKAWDSFMINVYSGTLDGNGKSIYGLYMAPSSNQGTYTGMFKQVDGANIKNLKLEEPYFVSNVTSSSSRYTGLLIGGVLNNAATIDNVDIIGGKFTANANSTNVHSFGSIAGVINAPSGETKVTNCDSSITLDTPTTAQYTYTSTNGGIGGIIGKAKGASGKTIVIDNCSFTGHINVPGTSAVGAIIGRGADASGGKSYVTIKNCWGEFTAETIVNDPIYGISKHYTDGGGNTISQKVEP